MGRGDGNRVEVEGGVLAEKRLVRKLTLRVMCYLALADLVTLPNSVVLRLLSLACATRLTRGVWISGAAAVERRVSSRPSPGTRNCRSGVARPGLAPRAGGALRMRALADG